MNDLEKGDEVNGWELEWKSYGTVTFTAADVSCQVKMYTHVSPNHDMGTHSVRVEDGRKGEKIAGDDDRDVALEALLDFVDEHDPDDGRAILDGDLDVDFGISNEEDDVDEDDEPEIDADQAVTPEAVKDVLGVHGIGARAFGSKDCFETWHDVIAYWVGSDGDFTDLEGVGETTSDKLRSAVRTTLIPRFGRPDGSASEKTKYTSTRSGDAELDEPVEDSSDTFVLVACSSLKAADEEDDVDEDDELPAREQYRGSLFKKSKKYAETIDAPYAILSGKYGVLEPDDEIEYYNVSVRDRDADEWGDQVVAGAGMTGPQGLRYLRLSRYENVVVFAGKAYREPIEHYLDSIDADVRVPLEGASGIGVMLSQMNDLLDELDTTDEQADTTDETTSSDEREQGDADDQGDQGEPVSDDEPVDVDERVVELEDAGLSGREAEVTAWKEQGLTHAEIGEKIGKSKSTVDEYSRRAGKKLEKARALLDAAGDLYA